MNELEPCTCGRTPALQEKPPFGYYYACTCGREGRVNEFIAGAAYYWNTMMVIRRMINRVLQR